MPGALRWAVPGLASALAFAACSLDDAPTREEGLEVSQVRYELDWEDGTATRDGATFVALSDLGVEVRVKAGYLTSYATSLVRCAGEPATALLGVRLGVRPAQAGHAFGKEPSTLEAPLVEDVVTGGNVLFGEVSFATASYCSAHYAIGAAPASARAAPEDVYMVGSTLYVAGTFERPGEPPAPFTYVSPVSEGRLTPLQWLPVLRPGSWIKLRIVRDRGTLFDGVTFEGAAEGAAPSLTKADEKRILSNVVEGARFELSPP